MAIGRSINLFLLDGNPDGVIVGELYNWTGKTYKIPRNNLKELNTRSDLKKAGVYFLFGRNDDDNLAVYIGEAEEVYKRLTQHLEKDFWSEALVFISKDENLNKAHIKYLEFILYEKAKETNRYELKNSNVPAKPSISEAEMAVMLEFSENLLLMTGTIGYRVFEKITKEKMDKKDYYYIKSAKGSDAKGIITSEGFVVLKDSKIANEEAPSIQKAFKQKRENLIRENVIKDWTFSKDYLFSSPSTAAAVVMGRSANGLTEWKKKDGTSIKDNE
jgi:hypothetical protein